MNFKLRTILQLLTRADKILAFFLIVISLSSLALLKDGQPGDIAVIEVDNMQIYRKDLTHNERFVVTCPAGQTTIEITNHSIRVVDSTCPNKLCVHQGDIHRTGELIVCVPNRMTIRIVGAHRNKFDAITG